MKRVAIGLVLVFCFFSDSALLLAADKPSLTIELKSEKKSVKEGEEVVFVLKIKNNGKVSFAMPVDRILYFTTSPNAGVTVMKETGSTPAKVVDAFLGKGVSTGTEQTEDLNPGEYFMFDFPLAFAQGEYTVIFEIKRFSPFTADMQSNAARISVTP